MELSWGIVFLFLTLSKAAPLNEKEVDIEKTILNVENILKNNVQLPRLTRDDIISLINHIQAEDQSQHVESKPNGNELTEEGEQEFSNEIEDLNDNILTSSKDSDKDYSNTSTTTESTTQSTKQRIPVTERNNNSDRLLVVLPYTRADGGLQELVTRPPRVALLRSPRPMESSSTEENSPETRKTLYFKQKQINEKQNNQDEMVENLPSFSPEIKEFLDTHGLLGNVGSSVLDGFKPFPTLSSNDEKLKSSEKVWLWHGLDNPDEAFDPYTDIDSYDPQHDLESLASNLELSVLALNDSYKSPKELNLTSPNPSFEPIDYDSVKVLPLNDGPDPLDISEEGSISLNLLKRQNNATVSENVTFTSGISSEETEKEVVITLPTATDQTNDVSSEEPKESPYKADLLDSFGAQLPASPGDSMLPPPKKNGFYFMLDWNSFLEVGTDDDPKYVNIRFEPKIGDPHMFLPVSVP